MPSLRGQGAFSSAPRPPHDSAADAGWIIIDFQPGADPFVALAEALSPLLSPPEPAELAADLLQGEKSLANLAADLAADLASNLASNLTSAAESPPRRLLIAIDAFEELYTLCPDPALRQAFLELLLAGSSRNAAALDPSPTETQSPLPNLPLHRPPRHARLTFWPRLSPIAPWPMPFSRALSLWGQ